MKRLREELRVIPGIVWGIVIVLYVCCVTLVLNYVAVEMPSPLRQLFGFGMPLIFCIFVLLAGYVYGDAKRRGMRPLMWMLLALLIPNAIGFILYFIMREPLTRQCPHCKRVVSGQFAFCPFCGATRAPACPKCLHPVEPGWPYCPHCGTELSAGLADVTAGPPKGGGHA